MTSTTRVQLALNVEDIDAATAFYTKLFGVGAPQAATRVRELLRRGPATQAGPVREPLGVGASQPPRHRDHEARGRPRGRGPVPSRGARDRGLR